MIRDIKKSENARLVPDTTGSANYVCRVEVLIERTAGDVWPYLLKCQSDWMTGVSIETVAGEKNQVGEVKRATLRAIGEEAEPFFFKTVLILPNEQFIYRAYTEAHWEKGIYDGYYFDGYEILSLVEIDGSTKVIFNAMLGMESTTMSDSELQGWATDKGGQIMWEENLNRLKVMVEKEGSVV